ncbi:MAG: MATE family efflux transporter [Lachnospiraceae bacterium]|nr:MATE family efflux transporter [Lachnospiraceae bacterium]
MKNKQLIINLVASVVVFLVQLVISFWLSPYIVKKLGEEANGFITLANNFVQYATLVSVAVNSMSGRFISIEYNKGEKQKAKEYFSSVFWMNVILSALIFVISVVLICYLEYVVNISEELVWDVKVTFVISFANLIVSFLGTVFSAATFVTNRMDLNSYRQIVANLIKVFVIALCFMCFQPRIYFVSLAALVMGIYTLIANIHLTHRLTPEFDVSLKNFQWAKIKTLVSAGSWMLVSNLSNLLLNGFDLFIANRFVEPDAMGRLSVSKQLPIAISSLLSFFSSIFSASFTELVARNAWEELLNEIKFTLKILALVLTVPFAGIIVYGTEFLTLWLPESVYGRSDIRQVYILMILELSVVIANAYMYSIHSVFIALNKVKKYSILILVSGITSIVVTLLLVTNTSLGVYAIAGTSTLILAGVNTVLVPLIAAYAMKIKPARLMGTIYKSYAILGVTCVMFYLIKNLLWFQNWGQFIVSALIAGIIGYCLNIWLLLSKEERRRLIEKIRKRTEKKNA